MVGDINGTVAEGDQVTDGKCVMNSTDDGQELQ